MPNWPSPSYNRLITTDPQIVKAPGAAAEQFVYGWGARPSLLRNMSSDPSSDQNKPGEPRAPEMTIVHVGK